MQYKSDKAKHDEVVKQVEEIMKLKKDLMAVNLPSKVDQIKIHIAYSEEKINHIVCDLFGLTSNEMKIIK